MRRIVYLSLGLLLICVVEAALAAQPLRVARGFQDGKCYSHPAVRVCDQTDGELSCYLRLFPNTNAEIHLPLDKRDFLIAGKVTQDYGVFSFKAGSVTRLIAKTRIRLREWDRTQEHVLRPREVACETGDESSATR
jgi:hypothetical protein